MESVVVVDQSPTNLIMVRPLRFGYDRESADSNVFQNLPKDLDADVIAERALEEFDKAVEVIRSHGINVKVFTEDTGRETPEAVFPNNWFSTHPSGEVVLYPMMVKARRLERRSDIVQYLEANFKVARVIDKSGFELEAMYLEGTGSVIFDYPNRKAYASKSPRTSEVVLHEVCKELKVEPILFESLDRNGTPIYHTNVVMWIGTKIAAACLDSIASQDERKMVERNLRADSGRVVVALSHEEMNKFCGNCLEVASGSKRFLVISSTAATALSPANKETIERFLPMIVVDVPHIERVGGGSIRCMLADVHLVE